MKEKYFEQSEKATKARGKYKRALKSFKKHRIDKYTLDSAREPLVNTKKLKASYGGEYERLKKRAKYESPDVSSVSSVSVSSSNE